jgi:predicted nucleic acid-binding protein
MKNDRIKLYLDTSVISHLDQQDAPDKMAYTLKLWDEIKNNKYDIVLSDANFNELAQCSIEKQSKLAPFISQINYQRIKITDEILATADHFIELKILTQKSYVDCQHIAAAIHAGCDFIVSWNFKHMVNVKIIRGAKIITIMEGYKEILLCSPNMLIEGSFDNDIS